jgi:hypothetical protein
MNLANVEPRTVPSSTLRPRPHTRPRSPPTRIPSTVSNSRLKSAASVLISSSVVASLVAVLLVVAVVAWADKVLAADSSHADEAALCEAVEVLPRKHERDDNRQNVFFSPFLFLPTSLRRFRCDWAPFLTTDGYSNVYCTRSFRACIKVIIFEEASAVILGAASPCIARGFIPAYFPFRTLHVLVQLFCIETPFSFISRKVAIPDVCGWLSGFLEAGD